MDCCISLWGVYTFRRGPYVIRHSVCVSFSYQKLIRFLLISLDWISPLYVVYIRLMSSSDPWVGSEDA